MPCIPYIFWSDFEIISYNILSEDSYTCKYSFVCLSSAFKDKIALNKLTVSSKTIMCYIEPYNIHLKVLSTEKPTFDF